MTTTTRHICSLAETIDERRIQQVCVAPAHWSLTYPNEIEGQMYACTAAHRDAVAARMGQDHEAIVIETIR